MKTNWPAFRCGCLILATVALGASSATLADRMPLLRHKRRSDFKRGDYTGHAARGRSRRRSRTPRCPCGADAEPGAIGVGLRRGAHGVQKSSIPGWRRRCVTCGWTIPSDVARIVMT